ncbi:FMN-dependent NADH-azoreductase [Flavobacterium sp. 2755]|uniref:FMN-dependent NADH-azoreductase n=1 Tax=Flavobacterium sp. 2755 TaxID=2817765 RepID=UPI002859B78F|nr:NAD(P)H-dependent oxidoreductase [Flavobacterium sp. 2755]MDR6763734.1 FMN-dependent NADH-azoreductase [Flavobacterium sp. 2755]
MKKVLVINSSVRTLNSHSRKLTEVFVEHWKNLHENPTITFREIGTNPVTHINENWVNAAFTPEAKRTENDLEILKTSDSYIAELHEADCIVLGAPMYNWSIPSSLKAYIDQVLRLNETFKINPSNPENPYVGLLENKTLFLLLSRGSQGYEKGEPNAHMNFQTDYLKTIFNMMGITNIHVIAVNGSSLDAAILKQTIENSHQSIKSILDKEAL